MLSVFDEVPRMPRARELLELERWVLGDLFAPPRAQARGAAASASWPRIDVVDAGASLVVTADVPGLADKDVTVTLHEGVLTLAGSRKIEAKEGYRVVRRERGDVAFTRSLELPFDVDAEATTASVKDGVLTVTLPKAKAAQPRQIPIKATEGGER